MRQLLPALAASTALHVAVLAVAASGSPAPVHLVTSAVEVDLFFAPSRQQAGVARSLAVPAHAAARRVSRRTRVPAHAEPAAPAAPAAPIVGETPPDLADTTAVPAAPPAKPLASPAAPAGASGPAARFGDLDVSAFFQRLQRAAQRCSGPRAGEGKVRFCVGADGVPTEVSLVQSTGNFALDDAALHCVIPGAAPFPRTDRCLVVPLRFQ